MRVCKYLLFAKSLAALSREDFLVSAAEFDRGVPSFFVAERRPIRLREGYLRYPLLDNAASIERGMNGDSLPVKIHLFVGESRKFSKP